MVEVGRHQREVADGLESLGLEERRGEGLGLALLRQTFVEFHRRGRRRVSLHVDVDNLTGALRLYTRAGMSPDPRLVVWQRERGVGRRIESAGRFGEGWFSEP